MARSFNNVVLLGNITRDPELKTTPNGNSVGNMSLALNRSYKDSRGEWQEVTDYVDIVIWGRLAERCADYLGRGSKILVNGRLSSRSWEKDGRKFSKVEVVANDVTFLDSKPDKRENKRPAGRPAKEIELRDIDDEESPIQKQQKEMGTFSDEPIDLNDIPF